MLKGAKAIKNEFCEYCVLEKWTRVKYGTVVQRTEGISDYVHTDVWGPTERGPTKNAS